MSLYVFAPHTLNKIERFLSSSAISFAAKKMLQTLRILQPVTIFFHELPHSYEHCHFVNIIRACRAFHSCQPIRFVSRSALFILVAKYVINGGQAVVSRTVKALLCHSLWHINTEHYTLLCSHFFSMQRTCTPLKGPHNIN